MKEIEFDEFFKDNFDTAGIEDNIYNQIAKDIARSVDIDLAKTPLVDILTGYTRYKTQELEIERLNKELEFEKLKNKEAREYIEKNYDDYEEFIYGKKFKEKILEILDKVEEKK